MNVLLFQIAKFVKKKKEKDKRKKEGKQTNKQTQIIVKDDGTWRKQP